MSFDAVTNPTSGSQAADQVQDPTGPKGNPPPSSTKSASDKIGNLGNLKEESPEVYKKMLEAMFQEVNKQQNKHDQKMKKIRQEGERGG